MSDNLRSYRAIRDAFTLWYPGQPTGTVARHLTTLAALISGMVGSTSTQLPSVATTMPDGATPESRGGDAGQLGALAPHDPADERRQRGQVPGDCACGLARIPLY